MAEDNLTISVILLSDEIGKENGKLDEGAGGLYSYDEAVELAGNGRYNYGLLVVCSVISLAMAMDMFGFSIIVLSSTCDFSLTMEQKGILSSIPFTGLMFSYFWGYFSDTRGRKTALMWSTCVGFMFAAFSSLAWNWYIMVILKFIGSSFAAVSFTLTITLLGECTGQKYRAKYLLIMNSINLGSEAVSFLLAYLVLPLKFSYQLPLLNISYRPWRLLTFLFSVPLALGALMLYFFHESPKFLANKGDTEEALQVLRDMYEKNGGKKEDYMVKRIKTEPDSIQSSNVSFCRSLWLQTAPIFKPPLLWRTVQIFYLLPLICSTNNVFAMWFPTFVNSFYLSFSEYDAKDKTFCERIVSNETNSTGGGNIEIVAPCNDVIDSSTIWAGMLYGVFFAVLNLVVSKLASRRKLVLIVTFLVSATSGILLNLVYEPIANMIFYVLLQATSIGLGITASYCVDLYPTSVRAMVPCLGIMIARLSALGGVILVGAIIDTHCSTTFYVWSIYVLSGVVVSLFLPPDRIKKS